MSDSRDGGSPASADPPELSDFETGNVEAFRDRLRVFAARRLRDWAAAEDVAQEAIASALEAVRASRLANPAALPGFLFQTAVHLCARRFRSAQRERRALGRFASGGAESGGNDGPLDSLLSAERQDRLREAIDRLEPDQRRLLELTYREELDSESIGRQLGVNAAAVRARRHRAIRRLAELLGVTRTPDRALKE